MIHSSPLPQEKNKTNKALYYATQGLPVEWVVEVHKDVWMDKVIVAVRKICFHNIKDGEYNMSSENNVLF